MNIRFQQYVVRRKSRVVAYQLGERRDGPVQHGSGGSNECRCRQKPAAEDSCEKYGEGEFAERSRGGRNGNGRRGPGDMATGKLQSAAEAEATAIERW